MLSKRNTWIICLAAVAFVLAGCGVATIPDEEVVGLAGSSTAGVSGDSLALCVVATVGDLPQGVDVDGSISWPTVGSLEYAYAIDYLHEDAPVADPNAEDWDEVTLEGSATLVVDVPDLAVNYALGVTFDATEFNDDPNNGRIVLDGSSTLTGSATWTNPHNEVTAGYEMDFEKTWTGVNMDDPSDWVPTGYPTSGTVRLTGSMDRYRDGPSGTHNGSWSGTILITFDDDGDNFAAVVVNGRDYLLDLSTGKVTPAP